MWVPSAPHKLLTSNSMEGAWKSTQLLAKLQLNNFHRLFISLLFHLYLSMSFSFCLWLEGLGMSLSWLAFRGWVPTRIIQPTTTFIGTIPCFQVQLIPILFKDQFANHAATILQGNGYASISGIASWLGKYRQSFQQLRHRHSAETKMWKVASLKHGNSSKRL